MTTQTNTSSTRENDIQEIIRELKEKYRRRNTERIAATIPLSREAELVHSEAYEMIQDVLPVNLPRRPIRCGHIGVEGCLYSIDNEELPGIMVEKTLASMTPINPGFLVFCDANEKKSPTTKDFLRSIIIHEYGHIFENMKTDPEIIKSIKESLAKSEAFAFWFADSLTGLKTLYPATINAYRDTLDVNKMQFLHKRLHETSAERGVDYVLRNHRTLMRRYSI